MELKWTVTAARDLVAIRDYIAADNPRAAQNWIGRLRARGAKIVNAPFAGRKVPELSRDDIREVIEGNYRIVYQVYGNQVSLNFTWFSLPGMTSFA
ncbi:type II toxin-antitoxin system RelE/ParE family toxin [Thiorhodovibrio frisius]|uniref:Plasmid stabilization system protein n=1 Tax=Thiorhodovibrio frisius TaxID=631362 RepID=H8Z3N3_9GAMM|nr:plasmid stabilization system protein [Thiorhodovibrio frisius]